MHGNECCLTTWLWKDLCTALCYHGDMHICHLWMSWFMLHHATLCSPCCLLSYSLLWSSVSTELLCSVQSITNGSVWMFSQINETIMNFFNNNTWIFGWFKYKIWAILFCVPTYNFLDSCSLYTLYLPRSHATDL